MHQTKRNIAIIGMGPAAMLAALALSKKNIDTYIIARQEPRNDKRTTAIMMPGIKFLQSLGLWQELAPDAAPLETMRIIDDTSRFLRARMLSFSAKEIGEPAFGYNVPNDCLNTALLRAVGKTKHIHIIAQNVVDYAFSKAGEVTCCLENGDKFCAALVIAADGKHSPARKALNIATKQKNYDQTALVLSFTHEYAHDNISTEIQTKDGPFTQVPLLGNRSSLIWTLPTAQANSVAKLSSEELEKRIEQKMQSMLGKVKLDAPLQSWRLSTNVAKLLAKNRILLIGEAAHSFPPIGAQGLNLTIRDIQALLDMQALLDIVELDTSTADTAATADIGDIIEASYIKLRKYDIESRAFAVHMLNKSLLSSALPWQLLRLLGFEAAHSISGFRRKLMQAGIAGNKTSER